MTLLSVLIRQLLPLIWNLRYSEGLIISGSTCK